MSPPPSTSGSTRIDRDRAQRAAQRQDRLYRAQRRRRCDHLHDPRIRPDRGRPAGAAPRSIRTWPSRSAPTAPARCKYSTVATETRRRQAVDQSIEIIRRRIDETGTKEPTIQREGQNRILVQLPGVDNPEHVKALLGRTAKLTFQLVEPASPSRRRGAAGCRPATRSCRRRRRSGNRGGQGAYVVRKRVMVGGDTLTDAQADLPEQRAGGQLQVRRRRRQAASATRPARMSASRLRSCSTTR